MSEVNYENYKSFPVLIPAKSPKLEQGRVAFRVQDGHSLKDMHGHFVIHQDAPEGPHYVTIHVLPPERGTFGDVFYLSQRHVDSIKPVADASLGLDFVVELPFLSRNRKI